MSCGVPRTCRASESVENIHQNKEVSHEFLVYNAETVLPQKDTFADATVSEENTGMDPPTKRDEVIQDTTGRSG